MGDLNKITKLLEDISILEDDESFSEDEIDDLKNEIQESIKFTEEMSEYVKKNYFLEFYGNYIAGVAYPEEIPKKKIVIIFYAPSHETDILNENKTLMWNPFKIAGSKNYVRTFQQLSGLFEGGFPFNKFFLMDMFPNKIWQTSMELTPDDRRIAAAWIKSQLILLKPDFVYVANKTSFKKHKKGLTKIFNSLKIKYGVVSHPGYTNRNQDMVQAEWQEVLRKIQ